MLSADFNYLQMISISYRIVGKFGIAESSNPGLTIAQDTHSWRMEARRRASGCSGGLHRPKVETSL
jgi:hypothetical protein